MTNIIIKRYDGANVDLHITILRGDIDIKVEHDIWANGERTTIRFNDNDKK